MHESPRPLGNDGTDRDTSLEPSFRCEVPAVGAEPVVVLTGELDLASAPELSRQLERLLERPVTRITLDLAGLTFIDSSGLGALCRIQEQADTRGVAVVLRSVPDHARRVLEITGLTGLFPLG